MRAVIRLVGGGVLAIVLGVLLYLVPEMDWYLPLPAFLVGPLLIGLGMAHWRRLQQEDKISAGPNATAGRPHE